MAARKMPWALLASLTALALATGFSLAGATSGGASGSNAANKAKAAGSSIEVLDEDASDTDLGQEILATSIKTSGPQDLILHLSLECALWTETQVTTIPNHPLGLSSFSRAEAHIVVWVTIDGVPVKVDGGDQDGKVAFCERVHENELKDMDGETGNFTLRTYLETRQANAFNWWKLDVGSGTHQVKVYADIESFNTEGAYAKGAIGKRTLIVDPAHFA
jgi:hypothetical protein